MDSRRRAVFPEAFSPGDHFLEEGVTRDRVVFRKIQPDLGNVPVAGTRQVGGRLFVKKPTRGRLDPKVIRDAIREDRDR